MASPLISALCLVLCLFLTTSSAQSVTVQFDETSYSVSENAGSLDLQVNATSSGLAPDMMVMVTITGFRGASLMDFNINNSGIQPLTFSIPNDALLSNDRMFEVILRSNDSNVDVIPPNTATVNITEDDMVTIGFDQMTYSVFEGDDVTVCVSLVSGMLATDREVVVTVSTDDTIGSGGAIMNMDFESLSMDLTFSNASMTTQCVTVSTIFNADMTSMPFNVNLSSSEAPSAVSLSPAFTTVTIRDVIAPTIMTQPMSVETALPNSNVTFTVEAVGDPLNYRWSRIGAEVPLPRATEATLTFESVTMANEGMYFCFIFNRAGNVTTDTVSLTVLRVPTATLLNVPTGVVVGEELTITCMAAANATIDLIVLKDSSMNVPLSEVETTANSRSVNITASSTGLYTVTCTADNNGLTDTTTDQFYAITIDVDDVTAGITATAVFFCNVNGAPTTGVTYQWRQTQNGVLQANQFPSIIYGSGRVGGRETATLTIINLGELEQDFDYTCNVSIGDMFVGLATGALTSPGPRIILGPQNQTLQAGENLTLSCTGVNNTDATQPLTINWMFTVLDGDNTQPLYTIDSPQVTQMEMDDNITVISYFTINNVKSNNSGEYGCYVFNRLEVQPVSANATVTVFFTPILTFEADPPMVPRGQRVTLTCTITAQPVANFSEIVRIMPDGDEVVVANQTNDAGDREFMVVYVFENPAFPDDDRAMFQCRATNDNGLAVEDVMIVVQARPSAINHANNVSAELVSLDSANIIWRIPPYNNAPIISYTLIFCTIASTPNGTVCGNLYNVTVPVGELTQIGDDRLNYTINGLLTEKMYEVVIRAENSVGLRMAPELGDGFTFNSAGPDNGRVENAMSIPAITAVIVTWNLPRLALATSRLNVSFNVTYFNNGDGSNVRSVIVDYDQMVNEQGVSIELEADSAVHTINVVAVYINPNLVSSLFSLPNVQTLRPGATLMPEAKVTNTTTGDELTVSWPAATNLNFLDSYRVSYTTSTPGSSTRRRRQASPVVVPSGQTSARINFTPYTDYMVSVEAVYTPPPDGTTVTVPLLPTTTFRSEERPSSPPLGPNAENVGILKIRLNWEVPTNPQGNIIAYRVNREGAGGTRVDGGLTFVTMELQPNTEYTFEILAINGFGDGMLSVSVRIKTRFNVVPPVITNTVTGNSPAGTPQFTITTDRFSDRYGRLGMYKVVVVRDNSVNSSTILDSNLLPVTNNPLNYYVAYAGNAGDDGRQAPSTFIIGDGSMTNDGTTIFTNPPPETGVNYYVFIRLYSAIDSTVFMDSQLTGVLVIATPLNPAVIIAPIATIAVLLLVILVVLLVVVFLFTRPRRGYSIAATGEDGVHRKKRGGGIELRRTRLFSPVVNVPVPDVFTSAGQPTTLVCEASGTPAPEVVWTQNNEPLDKERFIQLADYSLFINDTDLKDEGAYIVTATNSAGTAEQMVRVTVIRPSPPEPDPDHPPIKVGEFTEKIALLRANDDEGLEDEYSEVEPEITFTSYAAKVNINKNKNRYINIIPYDHSRVVLSLQDNTPGSDYINASYLDGFNRPNAYIATQGPQPSTFPDFWRMIWEFDCPTIVMVTNLKEEDKLKCHQYWPSYGTTTYGNVQVTLKGVENLAEYSIRTFHVTPIAGQSRVQMPVREVKQFHFLVWPDHGVPQFATPLLSFRKRVAKYHPDKKGPMVVHCSAGVGRTGTFVTIDTMLRQMEAEGVIDIFNYVRHMRFRRNYMVQTAPQYVFIHDALLEAIMCGDNSIPAPELRKRFQELVEVDPESNKSRLQLQFENLNSNSPQDDDFDSTIASLPDNMAKNRFKVHLPANDYRVPLGAPPSRSEAGDDDEDEDEKEKEEPDYICASFADGYRQRNAFIITQAPMSNTTGDFWKMIWEQKSAAIVMLTELEEDGKEMSVKYWPGEVGEASLFGSFQLELSEDEKDKGDYVTRKFKLSHVDAPQECRIVTQFHFTKWPRSSTPSNPHSVIDLIDEIQRVQRKSGNQPITIHCDDGVSRTGAFCTLYCVLERVKVDQVVDVYLATKTLRIQRAGLLETLDQYIFVHKAVIEFLDSFSDYQNFK